MKFMKLGSKPDLFQTNGKDVRFVGTELETDLIVNVGDLSFYLHKFPLLSKSLLLQRLVNNNDDNDVVELNDIPGGAPAFEICAKFCYGMTVTLNAYNVISAYCAAEYLEMNETTEKGNLIYKIEVFLNTSIFRSWKDSIIVIQTTKSLIPSSEDSKLVNHCIDSIACKASVDSSKVDWSYTYNRRNDLKKQQSVPKDWWVEDLCELDLELYKHVINAIKSKGKVSDKVTGEALKAYTCKRLPGFAKGNIIEKNNNTKGRALLETIIKLLPKEKRSVSCSFLTRLLRFATSLHCNETYIKGLVKKTGSQLDEALLHDLLLCGVDIVSSLVEEFVKHEEDVTPDISFDSSKLEVAKLVDAYLAEIAKDQELPISKFLALAEMVPSDSRPVHDGLYRAIDMYMKEHGNMTKSERKKLCNLMDCKKLSRDACAHAVQNERLPLRTVVQVLFFEQSRASATSSYGSSRSAATSNTTITTDDNWGAASIPEVADSKGDVKGVREIVKPKKMIGKVKSNSSSDTSSSQDEPKSTPLRKLSISRG